MESVVKALTPEEIEEIQAKQALAQLKASQVLPDGFQSGKVIKLAVAVEFAGTVYSEVRLRRLKGRDMMKIRQGGAAGDMVAIAFVADVPAAVLEEMDAEDFTTVAKAAIDFFPRSWREEAVPTGETGQGSPQ